MQYMFKSFTSRTRRESPRQPKALMDARTGTPGRPVLEPMPRMRWYA
jgi:hypothetical protein